MKTDFDYTVAELFDMLKTDESWEPNEELRVSLADELLSCLMSCE